jgi:hypothetical protein
MKTNPLFKPEFGTVSQSKGKIYVKILSNGLLKMNALTFISVVIQILIVIIR